MYTFWIKYDNAADSKQFLVCVITIFHIHYCASLVVLITFYLSSYLTSGNFVKSGNSLYLPRSVSEQYIDSYDSSVNICGESPSVCVHDQLTDVVWIAVSSSNYETCNFEI